jgi:hypothetical protein
MAYPNMDALAMGTNLRASYLQCQSMLKNYLNLDSVNISYSKLRYDNILSTTAVNNITFSPLAVQNTGSTSPSTANVLLNNGDVFFMVNQGFFISKQINTAYYGKQQLHTFANNLVFTGGSVGTPGFTEAQNLNEIYNGYYSLQVNVKTIIPNASMEQFQYADFGQYGAFGTAAAPFSSDTFDVTKQLKEIQPNPLLLGGIKAQYTIQIPDSTILTPVASATTPNVLTWMSYGFLLSGVSDSIIQTINEALYK